MLQNQEWESFTGRLWKEECNVRDFIQNNYTPYDWRRELPCRTNRRYEQALG